jgi:Protein of unknown function (DUF4054)
MSVTPPILRTTFPAFADVVAYPDPQIQFWIDLAAYLHDPGRWGELLDYGVQLFVAHNLTLEISNTRAGQVGAVPGQVTGAVTSGSVDKVSYSRDPGAAMDPASGHWNLSTYGLRYVRLIRMVGAGPVHVGAPSIDDLAALGASWQQGFPIDGGGP